MKINYILSDTTKCATSKTLEQVVLRAEKFPYTNFVIIVPETKSIIIEKEMLSLSKMGAVSNIYIYNFVRLLSRLNFIEKEKIISKQTAVMIIRKIILENYNRLKCYKKTAKNINFAEKIYDTLQQFKSSEVSVDDLKIAAMNAENPLKTKLEDIVLLYEEYEKLLGDSFFDDCDKLNLIKQFAKSNEFIKEAEVFVVGFDNITNEMVSVLEEIAKNVKEITFSSVYFSEKREDKYIQKNELFLKFRRVADNLKYPYIPTYFASHKKGDFYNIANNLFLPFQRKCDYKDNVKVFSANSKEQEIRFVASKIIELIKSGCRFKDIGVLDLDLETDCELIEKIFGEFEINYFINRQIDVANHYLINFIKLCFELYLSHLSKDKVLKFLKTQFVKLNNVDDFENFAYEYGLNYNDFLKPLSEEYKDVCKDFSNFEYILNKFQSFYIDFAKKVKESSNANDFINIVQYILSYFNVESVLSEISEFQLSLNQRENSQVSLMIFEKLKEFLQMFKNFIGSMNMSADEFLQVFLSGFSTIKLNLSPVSIDCVVVQNNTDGFYDIKNMFIVSATDENFPKMIQDMGIILDDELKQTNILSGKEIEPTTQEINAREKFIAYEALLEPSEKLFVSYSKQGIDGGLKKPSIIINKLISLFGENVLLKDFNQIEFVSKINYQKEFSKNIYKFYNNKCSIDDLNKQYTILLVENNKRVLDFLINQEKNNCTKDIKCAKELYFVNKKTSASQLETYFACPYRYFVNYGLKLKENKIAKLSKLDIGVILHKVAELFIKNINQFKNAEETKLSTMISQFVENVFEKLKLKKSKNRVAINFLFDESKRLCKYLLEEQNDSGFKAKYNEYSFNGKNGSKIKLVNNEELSFEGKIDRIDEFGDYVRIIDYKTGDIDSDLYSIYYGKKIQLVSYLIAISEIKNKKIAGLFYLPIHSDYVKNEEKLQEKYKMNGFLLNDIEVVRHMDNNLSFDNPKSKYVPISIKNNEDLKNRNEFEISRPGQKFLTEEEFNLLKSYNEELCLTAANEILSGYIQPSPIKKNNDIDSMPCAWCEYFGFCGLNNSKNPQGRNCSSSIDIKSFHKNEGK